MLVDKFLTPKIRHSLENVHTNCGFGLENIIRSGLDNPDSSIGAYAGCEDCYHKFSALFSPIIKEYHGYCTQSIHPKDLDFSTLEAPPNIDPNNKYILSTRIRVSRNIDGYALPPAISQTDRKKVEDYVISTLRMLHDKYEGKYHPLCEMSEKTRIKLVNEHVLFKKGDRFLESAGANRNWPDNRGIYYSSNKQFLVWVNEEDHLRIICMQKGSDIVDVFKNLSLVIQTLQKKVKFQFDPHLGYISSCPTNLGTGLRASVHIKLPILSKRQDFKKRCADLELSIRGFHGEHSALAGDVWDISNKKRLGLTEVDCVLALYNGVKKLIQMEIEARSRL